jgi:putative transposase
MSVAEPSARSPYRGYRFPPEIIAHAVWLYFRFHLSFRDVQDLLAERGIVVSHESIRQWCTKFGATFAAGLRRRRVRAGDNWHLDEVALKIGGKRHWLWRAVDQQRVVLDILIQERRDQVAAERFLRRVLDGEGGTEPRGVITDKLACHTRAIRRALPKAEHRRHKGLNNRTCRRVNANGYSNGSSRRSTHNASWSRSALFPTTSDHADTDLPPSPTDSSVRRHTLAGRRSLRSECVAETQPFGRELAPLGRPRSPKSNNLTTPRHVLRCSADDLSFASLDPEIAENARVAGPQAR